MRRLTLPLPYYRMPSRAPCSPVYQLPLVSRVTTITVTPYIDGLRRGMGFVESDDTSAASGKVFESHEEYARRLEGLMLLYGAIMQVRRVGAGLKSTRATARRGAQCLLPPPFGEEHCHAT